jgi:two-component system, OmpR family, alkaline phosphatase synthesis response regulator PhoP
MALKMYYSLFISNHCIIITFITGTKKEMEQKILIVDDEPHIRMLIAQTLEDLEDEGVEFLTAENGEIALEIIQRESPQLVFLDVMMPKMNGMEVCRRVKKELGLDHIFIVLLTAKGQEVDRQKGQDVGADVYMTKPFDPEVMIEKARKVLNRA